MGDFQEEQRNLSNLLCTGAICVNTTQNFVAMHNDSLYVILYSNY